MSIHLRLDRITPGTEIGPHRHGAETVVFVAGGEIVFVHGEELDRRVVVRAGDVLYEAPAERHTVRNEGSIDALALLASTDADSGDPGLVFRPWEGDGEPVMRSGESRIEAADGIRRRRIVGPGDFGTSTFAVSEVELEPGASDAWHRHPRSEQALVVFEGRGRITVGSTEEILEPLKGIRLEPGLAHRVENMGRTRLRYYVCAMPATDTAVDRELVEAPPRRLDA